jgi:hypothetical protein
MATHPGPETTARPPVLAPDRGLPLGYLFGSAAAFGLGCLVPAASVHVSGGQLGGGWQSYSGAACLTELPWVLVFPAWWANPLLAVGACLLAAGHYRGAGAVGAGASLLAATALCSPEVQVREGFFCWLLGMGVLAFGGLHGAVRRHVPA